MQGKKYVCVEVIRFVELRRKAQDRLLANERPQQEFVFIVSGWLRFCTEFTQKMKPQSVSTQPRASGKSREGSSPQNIDGTEQPNS